MQLHYNKNCIHRGLPTTPLRLMYATRQYTAAKREIERLDALELSAPQRLVVEVHKVVVQLAQDGEPYYREARARLKELAADIAGLDDENFTAEFRARRLCVARRYNDHVLADFLTNNFFRDIPRTAITEAYWRVAQGVGVQRLQGPEAAISYYETALMLLETAKRYCLQEMVARRLAFCVDALGDHDRAVEVLTDIQLPASIEPQTGYIALADLLVIPE